MEKYKLDVRKIKSKKENEVSFDVKVDFGDVDLRGQKIEIGKIRINGQAVSVDDGIVLNANAKGLITLICSRCLIKYAHPLNIEIKEFYAVNDFEAEHKVEDNLIDVSGVVIEALALQLDLKTLCKEDCAGLCPQCGTNKNIKTCQCEEISIDTRWDKLQELKNKLKDSDIGNQEDSKE